MKNQQLHTEDYYIVEQVFAAFNIRITQDTKTNFQEETFYTFNNPDGTLRWIWSSNAENASFLEFYSVNNFKAKLFTVMVRLIFLIKLQSFFFKKTKLHIHINDILNWKILKFNQFTIFTGTPGKYRKAVCFHFEKEKPVFSKVALTGASLVCLAKEYKGLLTWDNKFKGIITPEIIDYSNPSKIIIGSIKTENSSKIKAYSPELLTYQNRLIEGSHQIMSLSSSSFYSDLAKDIQKLKELDNNKIPMGIKQKLVDRFDQIAISDETAFTYCHGDFTPWNSYIANEQFYLYDLEFSKTEAPLYYDLIHFHFQEEILVRHNFNGFDICKKIAQFLNVESKEDLYNYIELYLLKQATHSLLIYEEQKNWHVQINWLIKVWNDALTETAISRGNMRELLISDILDRIHATNHALLKSINENPYQLSLRSDLDVCIDKTDAKEMIKYVKKHPAVEKLRIRKKSFMTSLDCFTKNGGFFSIDLLYKLKRKNILMTDTDSVLSNAHKSSSGIKVPHLTDGFLYIYSFYTLNKTDIPEKYISYYNHLKIGFKSQIMKCLYDRIQLEQTNFDKLAKYSPENNIKLTKYLSDQPFNRGLEKWANNINYLLDSFRQLFNNSGIIITFSGVDGAGKSTIINHVKNDLEKVYRKNVIVLRHRPSILPILSAWKYGKAQAEARAVSTLPRQGENKSRLSSALRFLYYYLDYVFGQWIVYFKYLRRGYIVLYDRYYYDFINDGKRSNIHLSESFVKSLYALVAKPDYNFFLYADAETITNRKKELSKPVIEELTHKYLNLFDQFSSKYSRSKFLPMENIQLEATLSGIMNTIKTKL
ncbi:nucleoside/nucleotide kinase family protein [Fulvivirga sediminis]|uniref:Thymidylate kinase n=1 Tax=Fulvivirga sediminis TaxID=2803949 RepID=A0A937JZL7_9BACT|nr:hypothetical protein [Fulvivirga sediminis]MBL3656784.1 hypothetical protein [Fulvivirga sediminis]